MSRSLNILVVASELPYPATAGGRIRTLNLVVRLARRHRITFIAHPNGESALARRFLEEHGVETILVDATSPAKTGPRFYADLAANLFSPLPYSVAAHSSQALRSAVRARAREHRIDVCQVETTVLIDALADLQGYPKIVQAPNVESLIWQRYAEAESNPLKRWYINQQLRKFEHFERRAFAHATRVAAVSQEDARLIRDRFGREDVDVVDNGIDRAFFESVHPEPDPRTILFLGSLDWRPNLDAVGLLLDRIFPVVRAAEPGARLCVVGRRPPRSLIERVRAFRGVELHTDVPDVRPFLAKSGMMAVPLRVGGGSRVKILEAMAAGLPVVSTRVGAEGLELVPGTDYTLADEPAELADALVALLRDPSSARARAERCRRFVLERYDWDTLALELEQVWLSCVEEKALSRSVS